MSLSHTMCSAETLRRLLMALALYLGCGAGVAHAATIQALCDIKGVRSNQLIGYGLVVGLQGTGDTIQARFTIQSTAALLRRLGSTIDPKIIQTRNAAAVMVTATLPPFSNPGTRIDVTVSSMGNARSLLGGTLLQTPLYGADRKVYAVAQGPLVVGGFSASGASGSSVGKNVTTAGSVPQGAIVERRVRAPKLSSKVVYFALRQPSFVTARRIVAAISEAFGEQSATAQDSATIRVQVPESHKNDPVGLVAAIQMLEVQPDAPAKVVIDERTGTVVLGGGVRISEVAIAQGGLTVEISEQPLVSQPNPLGQGGTAVVPNSEVTVEQGRGSLHHLKATASLSELVSALNALGADPRDLLAIFQALRRAGALQAEIEVQ
ncbi:MAG: flagellar basal body P-ring protein FlgI [Proteobacteria bacterium]|nr:flagellar basal body P-ring protein FlgI [Pseudomonadota bacterium]